VRWDLSPKWRTVACILVVEDDWRIGAFLDRALTLRGYQVHLVRNGSAALGVAHAGARIDLVILDLTLPDMDGLDVARQLRIVNPIPILMLTARDTIGDRVRGLDAGADDYLVKPFALEELLARVRAILRRAALLKAQQRRGQLAFHQIVIDHDVHDASIGGDRLQLRNREFELLAYLVCNPQRALSRRELREEVWGDDFPGGSNVIEVTVFNLRRKLDAHGLPDVVQTVRPIGYMLRWPTEPDV
jgi:two-component system response regulator MprA